MEHIEPETEVHRSQKAIKQLLGRLDSQTEVVFPQGKVLIYAPGEVIHYPGGQLALALIVNLLSRMKMIISDVAVRVPYGISLHSAVPLTSPDLRIGLETLVNSLSGENSYHTVRWNFDDEINQPTVTLSLGSIKEKPSLKSVVCIGADAWTAYINPKQNIGDWSTEIPFGPHLAATLGVTEVFKQLLLINFPDQIAHKVRLADNEVFCAFNYSTEPHPEPGWNTQDEIILDGVAIAGLGAGGSAAIYTLSCLPYLGGELTLIDPGKHKRSNLARYLLTNYDDCENGTSKIRVAKDFIASRQSRLSIRKEELAYAEVFARGFQLVVSTVDTPEARWDIQNDFPPVIIDAAVIETIYSILRVVPGGGMCLGCKHPYDTAITWKHRARTWGMTVEEAQRKYIDQNPISHEDLTRLAEVQGHSINDFIELLGMPFDKIPALTECGQSHFNLQVPNQMASLPFVTTMAGILVAAEIIKDLTMPDQVIHNWFEHDLLWVPKFERYRFRPAIASCRFWAGSHK